MSKLDYGHTCSDIDKQLRYLKQQFDNTEIALCDTMPDESETIRDYFKDLWGYTSDAIEEVRSTNSNLRNAAELQIEELENRIRSLEDELNNIEIS